MSKPFSKELYEECNLVAMNVAAELLTSLGNGNFYRIDKPISEQVEAYKSHDFVITYIKNNQSIYVEVEKKNVWTLSGKWQGFNTIDVPYRKSESNADLFVMINKHNDTAAISRMENVKASPVESKRTIYTTDEQFFKVELSSFKFYGKQFNKWNEFKPLKTRTNESR